MKVFHSGLPKYRSWFPILIIEVESVSTTGACAKACMLMVEITNAVKYFIILNLLLNFAGHFILLHVMPPATKPDSKKNALRIVGRKKRRVS